jgi:hypothetical protein
MKTYKQKEIETPNFTNALMRARTLWYDISSEEFTRSGDRGCCTLGGGLYMDVIRPRCRIPKHVLILRPPYPVQGEVPLYAGMTEARDLLKDAGFETYCNYGRMD